jgi:hypothetical protein
LFRLALGVTAATLFTAQAFAEFDPGQRLSFDVVEGLKIPD